MRSLTSCQPVRVARTEFCGCSDCCRWEESSERSQLSVPQAAEALALSFDCFFSNCKFLVLLPQEAACPLHICSGSSTEGGTAVLEKVRLVVAVLQLLSSGKGRLKDPWWIKCSLYCLPLAYECFSLPFSSVHILPWLPWNVFLCLFFSPLLQFPWMEIFPLTDCPWHTLPLKTSIGIDDLELARKDWDSRFPKVLWSKLWFGKRILLAQGASICKNKKSVWVKEVT